MHDFISTCTQEPVRYARNHCSVILLVEMRHLVSARTSTACKEAVAHYFRHVTSSPYMHMWQYGTQRSCTFVTDITSSPYMAVQYARKPPFISGSAPPHSTACKEDITIYQCGHVYNRLLFCNALGMITGMCLSVSTQVLGAQSSSPSVDLTSFPGCSPQDCFV